MTKKRYYFLVILLGALTTIAPFSIDMYLPGFTAIAKDLLIPMWPMLPFPYPASSWVSL